MAPDPDHVVRLDASAPLPVDGRQAWIVQSGSVALFSLRTRVGVTERRRHLVDVNAGEAVLWQPGANGPDVHIVALESSVLVPSPMDQALTVIASRDAEAEARLRRWLDALNVEIAAAGLEPCVLPEGAGNAASVASLLALAQERFVGAVERRDARRDDEVRERFLSRQRIDEQIAEETLEGLTAFDEAPVSSDRAGWTGSPMLAVMRRLGVQCGIDVRAPADLAADGVSLQQVLDASGVRGRPVILSGDWWRRDGEPLVGSLESTHEPVGLVPVHRWFRGVGYRAIFGAGPPRDVDRTLAGDIAPGATAIYPSIPGVISTRNTVRWALAGSRRELLVASLSGLAVVLIGMVGPQATKVLFETTIPDGDRRGLLELGAVLLAAAGGSLLFDLARSLSFLRFATGAAARLQLGVWDRLLDLGPAFFRGFSVGDLESRVHAVTAIRAWLNVNVLSAIIGAAASVLYLGLLLAYSPQLTLVAIVVAIVGTAITVGASLRMRRTLGPFLEADGQLSGLLIQLIGAVPKLRIAGAETRAFAEWGRAYAIRMQMAQRLRRLDDRAGLLTAMVGPVATAALFWFTAADLFSPAPRLSVGTYLAFSAAFGTFLSGVMTLGSSTGLVFQVAALWARLQPILEAEPEVHSQRNPPGRLTGQLRVDHVTFRYRPDGPLTLDDVSIRAEPGECIALVGPSGSGKSTIANLLLRFITPASGAVYLDRHDLKGLDIVAVRRQMGVVSQENSILAGTIFDNITCGLPVSHDQAWEAARAAAIEGEIREMPMGLHTFVSEGGTNLSGGQRQRLLVARALLRKPVIMILDEATSALDNRSQAIVTDSLNRLKVTRVLIAHRLSTIRRADRIYVIDAGRVVQHGSFDELIAQDGLFARLMRRQAL